MKSIFLQNNIQEIFLEMIKDLSNTDQDIIWIANHKNVYLFGHNIIDIALKAG